MASSTTTTPTTPTTTPATTTTTTWRDTLLNGITEVPLVGLPGRVVVFGERAEPILTGRREEDILLAVTRYGQGGIVAFSHDGYVGNFGSTNEGVLAPLFSNIRRWLIGEDSSSGVLRLTGSSITEAQLLAAKIAVWFGGRREPITSQAVLNFVHRGGGLIVGMCPWGWLQLNRDTTLRDMPYWSALATVGLCFDEPGGVIKGQAKFLVSENKAENAHAVRLLQDHSNDIDRLITSVDLLKTLRSAPQVYLSETTTQGLNSLMAACATRIRELLPSNEDTNLPHLMELWHICVELLRLTSAKAPECEVFPGDFSIAPELKRGTVAIASSVREEIYSTGYYAPAGQVITVDVTRGNTGKKWTLYIGAHLDVLSRNQLRRWPKIHTLLKIKSESHSLSSPFGGLIYLKSPEAASDGISLTLGDVVEAPQYSIELGPQALTDWNTRRTAPGLWADIIGRYVMITVPAASVRDLADPGTALRNWDRTMEAFHELRGTDVTQHRKQWIVADEQPSAGYMHAGYPIVTHLDVAESMNSKFMLNAQRFSVVGNMTSWGLFHEIGHNMTRREWTFSGTGEVTCNIFTLYAMDLLCEQPPWPHSNLKNKRNVAIQYLRDGADIEVWKGAPYTALFFYAQLARDFGWEAYRRVFRRYETMEASERPTDDRDKVDDWFRLFSETVSYNIVPLGRFWGLTVRRRIAERLDQHPAYLPDDEITQAVPDRTSTILEDYTDVVRRPVFP